MPNKHNFFINSLFVLLITYTAYVSIFLHFGLEITYVIQLVLLVLLILGFLAYIISTSSRNNSWINWSIAVWITQFMSYFLFDSSSTTEFKESTFVLLCAIPIISQKYNSKYAKKFIIFMSLVSISMYFVNTSLNKLVYENSYGGGYMALVSLPVLLYFFRHKPIRTLTLITIIIFILVLISMKRGDILACVLMIFVYNYIILKHKRKIALKVMVSLITVSLIGYGVFQYMLETSEVFSWRFEQTKKVDSSGRDDIYLLLFNHFLDAPLHTQLFGSGFDASVKIAGNRAHSDILEVLTSGGLVSLGIYLGFLCSLFRQMSSRINLEERAILASICVIWLVKMIFSMFIFAQSTIILFVLTGYILNNKIDKQYEN